MQKFQNVARLLSGSVYNLSLPARAALSAVYFSVFYLSSLYITGDYLRIRGLENWA